MTPGSSEARAFREDVAKAVILRVIATGEGVGTVYVPERVVEYAVSFARQIVDLLSEELK